jgi:UPF0288 family protein (methanogenesis marker protein 3)
MMGKSGCLKCTEHGRNAMEEELQTSMTDKEVLSVFKRQVKGYIKWLSKEEKTYGTVESYKQDCKAVTKAKTFDGVVDILKKYDDGFFMYLVSKGYF